ncbi:MAG: hypothetical protein D8H94_00860 [Cardiobacterium sp.]|nr:MAG: hypothetical protein D8H94_00860 [Cardiobacterium sp.]
MAYMNQQKKRCIADALQTVVPTDWQYALFVDDCKLSIIMEIQAAPVDFMALKAAQLRVELQRGQFSNLLMRADDARRCIEALEQGEVSCLHLNTCHIEDEFPGEITALMVKIVAALNTGNYDSSCVMADHFDVGHYVELRIGYYTRPFRYIPKPAAA